MEDSQTYDTVIIGGGPAGISAAIYAGRKKMKTLLIADSFGGQSIVSNSIQNWIGEPHISGLELAKKLETHLKVYSGVVEVKSPERVTEIKSIDCMAGQRVCDFEVITDKNKYKSKTVILAHGARRKKLGVLGEDNYQGKGVAYCTTCDAPLFTGKKVVVVGSGNAGLEAVHDLFPYASEIYLLEYGDSIRGDVLTLEEVKKNPKLKEIMLNTQILEILGEGLVTGLKIKNAKTGEEKKLDVEGVFVEIGSIPNSEIVKNLVQLDEYNQVMINFQFARTSHPGIFAAGDITNDPYKQNNISAGDGIRAALSAFSYIHNREKVSPASEKDHQG